MGKALIGPHVLRTLHLGCSIVCLLQSVSRTIQTFWIVLHLSYIWMEICTA